MCGLRRYYQDQMHLFCGRSREVEEKHAFPCGRGTKRIIIKIARRQRKPGYVQNAHTDARPTHVTGFEQIR